MRTTTTAVFGLFLAAAPAFAQRPSEKPPVTLNFGPGLLGESKVGKAYPVTTWVIGADIPMSARWTLRTELGGRWPGSKRSYYETLYYSLPNPARPNDPPRVIARSDTERVEDSLADVALLVRFGTPADRRFQFGALAGPHIELLRTQSRTLYPRYGVDPSDFKETFEEKHHMRGVLDVGVDAGFKVDDRWTVLGYALVGLQSPREEQRREQLRGGVLVQRRF